jgi:hypothetical protein
VSAVATSIIFEIVRQERGARLQVRRLFDGALLEFTLPQPDERIREVRRRLPAAVEPFRRAVGPPDSCALNMDRASLAALHLDRLALSILDLLLVGSGWRARQFIDSVADHIRPAFRSPSGSEQIAPIVELRSSATDPLASLLPMEFIPIADVPSATGISPEASFAHRMSRYMGFRSIIVRNLRGGKTCIPRDPNGLLTLNIVAYQDANLPGITRQLQFFRSRPRDFNLVEVWPDLTKVTRGSAPDSLAAIIHRLDAALLHFCCHFRPAGRDESEPLLEFEDAKKFSGSHLEPLRVRLIELRGALANLEGEHHNQSTNALVFANACRSAVMDDTGESLVSFLMEKQQEQLVGGEGLLPDLIAGEFAVRFYTALLRGATAGEAMLTARRDLLERFRNPAGLLYTAYGDPELTFESLPRNS